VPLLIFTTLALYPTIVGLALRQTLRLYGVFQSRRKYFCFQNALGYLLVPLLIFTTLALYPTIVGLAPGQTLSMTL
jgi:hypothetical protein